MPAGIRSALEETIPQLGEALGHANLVEAPFDDPIEEKRIGDPDRTEDDRFYEPGAVVTTIEPDLDRGKKDISSISFDDRFAFFLDGSIRTKYLGDYPDPPNLLRIESRCLQNRAPRRLRLCQDALPQLLKRTVTFHLRTES